MFRGFTDKQTKDNISVTQHKLKYNIGVAMQYNAAQHYFTISNTGKFGKMVHPDFPGDSGGRNPYHSDSENLWLQLEGSDEDIWYLNGKPSTPSFALSSAQYYYVHNLLTVPAKVPPLKHCFTHISPKP